MGDFLAEDGDQRLLEGIDEAAAGIEGKVEDACRQQGIGAERAADQAVDDVLQDEGGVTPTAMDAMMAAMRITRSRPFFFRVCQKILRMVGTSLGMLQVIEIPVGRTGCI